MPTNKNNLTVADADAMGRELIFEIAANNFTAFKTLIKNTILIYRMLSLVAYNQSLWRCLARV